jgi:hypothetical protein
MMGLPDAVQRAPAQDPFQLSGGRLRQALVYWRKVFFLPKLLGLARDGRKDPRVLVDLVVRIVFLVGLLRIRSFNALEPKLAELQMQHALDAPPRRNGKVCSVDVLGYSLARMDLASVREMVVQSNRKAERNKMFREGWIGALRYVGIDGWEPICSRTRHCPHCLTRKVRVKIRGKKKLVTEYFHRYVVALLLDDRLEVVLDMEPIRSADVRREAGDPDVEGHEGELTAAKRLVRRLKTTYGRWIDVLVGDSLYANGPFFTLAKENGYGLICVLKKKHNEPLKEALALWDGKPPQDVVHDRKNKERIELWDCPDLQTLSSYKGAIRAVRGIVHGEDQDEEKKKKKKKKQEEEGPTTWCFGVTGKATRLSMRQVVRVGRGRWHLENTGFNQWTQHWHFTHVFTHSAHGLQAIFWLFFLVFNLLQCFLYRQLRCYGRDRGKDVTQTILRLIDEMRDDLARLDQPECWDTS